MIQTLSVTQSGAAAPDAPSVTAPSVTKAVRGSWGLWRFHVAAAAAVVVVPRESYCGEKKKQNHHMSQNITNPNWMKRR